MKLVVFQQPIFPTIQGEGVLVGTPSTFVRLWGCDFSCSWCDTKKSWEPGSSFVDVSPSAVLDEVKAAKLRHVVITGGNPLLQGDELGEVIKPLWLEGGYHVTIETQGSVFHPVVRHANLLSLSPKLHDWRQTALDDLLRLSSTHSTLMAQIKIVVQDASEIDQAIVKFRELDETRKVRSNDPTRLVFVLQPEYSVTKKVVSLCLDAVQKETSRTPRFASRIKIIPQLHKTALSVV